jgi:hypothetical protein
VKKEIWKDIQNFEGLYQISNLGRVKSLDRYIELKNGTNRFVKGRVLKPSKHKTKPSYYNVILSNKGKRYSMSIHRLVAEHFIPNKDGKPQVNHKDGDKLNNKVNNLEWVTYSENTIHSFSIGLSKGRKGENHHNNKLTYKEVRCIKELLVEGELKQSEIANKFKISFRTVSAIKRGVLWRHVEI